MDTDCRGVRAAGQKSVGGGGGGEEDICDTLNKKNLNLKKEALSGSA